ncbi:MAG TPA: GNAT family N-acetyltransferase [Candidatus Saccharimonadales bacterium]|nr:GNAT family N-acetyltransferase [Candidatus Saccharimonadales bacterium]
MVSPDSLTVVNYHVATGPAQEIERIVSWIFAEGFEGSPTDSAAVHYSDVDAKVYGLVDAERALFAGAVVIDAGRNLAELRRIAARRDMRRQGLGGRLLTAVEADLAASGTSKLEVCAYASAAGFYDKLGYTRDDAYCDVVSFYKQLAIS